MGGGESAPRDRGEMCLLGVKLSLGWEEPLYAPTFILNSKECSPLGVSLRIQSSPLGAKLTPRSKLVLLKTVLSGTRQSTMFWKNVASLTLFSRWKTNFDAVKILTTCWFSFGTIWRKFFVGNHCLTVWREARFKKHGLPPGVKFVPRGELGP
jgi:hypothetical protein